MDSKTDIIHQLGPDEIGQVDMFRKSKNTAVLTILFSDIEQSTLAAEKLGEVAFASLRHLHDKLFKDIMTRDNAGRIIKEIGDSFLCVFSEPSTAVERAVEFQQTIALNRDQLTIGSYTLKVKVGIHLGQVAIENHLALDVFGRHVNRAARIQALATGGQVLTSKSIWENASGWVQEVGKSKIKSVYYGKAKLKGIQEAVEIYGFFPVDGDQPPVPYSIANSKKRRIISIAVAMVVIVLAVLYSWNTFFSHYSDRSILSTRDERKTWYVHFDFSSLKELRNIDTTQLRSEMITQIATSLYPDSLVDDEDLRNHLSSKGVLYTPRYFWNNDSLDFKVKTEYYRDSLNLLHVLDVQFRKNDFGDDTCIMILQKTDYEISEKGESNKSVIQKMKPGRLSMISEDFRDFFNYFLQVKKSGIVHGTVMQSSDSQFVCALSAQSKLRKGAMLKIMRRYEGSNGRAVWLKDIKEIIEFSRNKKELQSEFITAQKSYGNISKMNFDSAVYMFPLHLNAQVLEIYDSTGVASWRAVQGRPWERPRPGDEVHLKY